MKMIPELKPDVSMAEMRQKAAKYFPLFVGISLCGKGRDKGTVAFEMNERIKLRNLKVQDRQLRSRIFNRQRTCSQPQHSIQGSPFPAHEGRIETTRVIYVTKERESCCGSCIQSIRLGMMMTAALFGAILAVLVTLMVVQFAPALIVAAIGLTLLTVLCFIECMVGCIVYSAVFGFVLFCVVPLMLAPSGWRM